MIFVFTCKDKPGHLQTRVDNRPTHVEYLNKLNAEGTLKFAGPFLDGDGDCNGAARQASSGAVLRVLK